MKPPKPTLARPAARIRRRRRRRGQKGSKSRIENFFLGVALAAFGISAWGWQQNADWVEPLIDWWPMLLVWLGLGKLVDRHFAPGVGLVFGGALVQLHILRIADLEYTWPLVLVAIGVAVTAGALLGGDEGPNGDDDSDVSMAEELDGEVEVADEIRAEEVRHGST